MFKRMLRDGEEVKSGTSAAESSGRTVPAPPSLAHDLLATLGEKRTVFAAFVRRRVRSDADAEDILQQALLKAASKLDTVRDGERVDAWFYRVLRNAIADYRVDFARRESRLEAFAREASEAAPEEAAVCGCSLGVLDALHAEYAAILRRVDLDEESLDEAARALGITANNAKVRLHRARKALRAALLSYCGTDSVRTCQSCSCE